MGGMVEAIELGYPQKEIAEASYQFQQAVERKEKVIVGVNDFVQENEPPIADSLHRRHGRRRPSWRASTQLQGDARQRRPCAAPSTRCKAAARGTGNTMEPLLDCVRAYCDRRRDVRCPARRLGRVGRDADHLAAGS